MDLLQCGDAEDLAMISVQLASKFLFNVGFHSKKTLRYVLLQFPCFAMFLNLLVLISKVFVAS